MDNSAMTIQAIPIVGTRLVGQGAKEELEVQEAQKAQDVEDADKEKDSIYSGKWARKLSRHRLSNCIRLTVCRIKSWLLSEA